MYLFIRTPGINSFSKSIFVILTKYEKKNKKISAGILVIGNEILSGRTIDKNISFLALWLNNNLGIKVSEVRIVPDIESRIVKNVLSLSKKNNYVLTTGGIGPTHDDITSKSISKAFKKNIFIIKKLIIFY